jgi:hypothetical protein
VRCSAACPLTNAASDDCHTDGCRSHACCNQPHLHCNACLYCLAVLPAGTSQAWTSTPASTCSCAAASTPPQTPCAWQVRTPAHAHMRCLAGQPLAIDPSICSALVGLCKVCGQRGWEVDTLSAAFGANPFRAVPRACCCHVPPAAGYTSGQPNGFALKGFVQRDDIVTVATVRVSASAAAAAGAGAIKLGWPRGATVRVGGNSGSVLLLHFFLWGWAGIWSTLRS